MKIIGTMLKKRNEDTGIGKVGQELLGRSPKSYMLGQKTVPLPNVPALLPHLLTVENPLKSSHKSSVRKSHF